MDDNKVFVRIDDFKDVLAVMESIKGKLAKSKDTLDKIREVKKQEDAELELWSHSLDEVEHKLNEVDSRLLTPDV
jgi:hypothetical protein